MEDKRNTSTEGNTYWNPNPTGKFVIVGNNGDSLLLCLVSRLATVANEVVRLKFKF